MINYKLLSKDMARALPNPLFRSNFIIPIPFLSMVIRLFVLHNLFIFHSLILRDLFRQHLLPMLFNNDDGSLANINPVIQEFRVAGVVPHTFMGSRNRSKT